MSFEDELSTLNEWHFFREFAYSRNTFRQISNEEVELADSLVWLGDLLIVFQLKQRGPVQNPNAQTEHRWFKRKILGKATRQIRNTLEYLCKHEAIEIRNSRDQRMILRLADIRQLHKLVVYLGGDALPDECRRIKHHRSRTAGIIHIIAAHDYLGIVRTLLTPIEVAEYFSFREELINQYEVEIANIPEPALMGQFLNSDSIAPPSREYIEYLRRLDHRADEWDMSGIIAQFPDRITSNIEPTDYYHIVRELASLKRNEMRKFKERFVRSVEHARADEFVLPYRITIPRTGCGFVFIPLTREMLPHRRNGLQNFTLAHKYDHRLSKCIGVSIADDGNGQFTAEWCHAESPWQRDPDMERLLSENNPFRDTQVAELPRYNLDSED